MTSNHRPSATHHNPGHRHHTNNYRHDILIQPATSRRRHICNYTTTTQSSSISHHCYTNSYPPYPQLTTATPTGIHRTAKEVPSHTTPTNSTGYRHCTATIAPSEATPAHQHLLPTIHYQAQHSTRCLLTSVPISSLAPNPKTHHIVSIISHPSD